MKNRLLSMVAMLVGGTAVSAQEWPGYWAPEARRAVPHAWQGPAYPAHAYPPAQAPLRPSHAWPPQPTWEGRSSYAAEAGRSAVLPSPAVHHAAAPQHLSPAAPAQPAAPAMEPAEQTVERPAALAAPAEPLPRAQPEYPPVQAIDYRPRATPPLHRPAPHAVAPPRPDQRCVLPPPPCVNGGHIEYVPPKHFRAPPPNPQSLWFSADYLLGVPRKAPAVPLVTTGSGFDDPPAALDQAGTAILFGGSPFDFGLTSGVRAELGLFFEVCNRYSLDVGWMWLPPDHITFVRTSDDNGNPILARPIFNVVDEVEEAYLISLPTVSAGSIRVDVTHELWGIETNGRLHWYKGPLNLQLLGGFRYLQLNEGIRIHDRLEPLVTDALTFLGDPISPPDSIFGEDNFQTRNRWVGFQVGGKIRYTCGRFYVDAGAKIGVGVNEQRVDINGQTALITDSGTEFATGGILAQITNIGLHTRHVFSFVPEGNITLGVDVTECLRVRAGYSILYWHNVVRPGDHIDRGINPFLVPTDQDFDSDFGPPRPEFRFRDTNYWIHFFNFGVELHF